MDDVHIALVGCGRWGANILRDLRDLGASVTAVARSEASIERARAGGAGVVASIDDLSVGPSIDGVVVATPTSTHVEVVRGVLDLGVPVFVEKPLGTDVAACEALVSEAGERIFVMDKWRYHPGIEALGSLARSGDLGDLVGLSTVRHQWGSAHRDVDVVWVLAPHDLSIAMEILGALPEPVSAVADRSGGSVTGLRGFLSGDVWHSMSVSARAPVWERSVTVFGTDAVAILADSFDDEILVFPSTELRFGDPPDPHRVAISTEMPLRGELDAFLGHVRGGPPPKADAAAALASVRAIDRLRALAGASLGEQAQREPTSDDAGA
jgi:predicted dehydrogenase